MSNVIDILRQIRSQRGRKSELLVETALAEMKNDNEILRFYKTGKREDKIKGIDFFVITLANKEIPLQVKSSLTGVKKHQKKFPKVPAVRVDTDDTDTKIIKRRIREALRQ